MDPILFIYLLILLFAASLVYGSGLWNALGSMIITFGLVAIIMIAHYLISDPLRKNFCRKKFIDKTETKQQVVNEDLHQSQLPEGEDDLYDAAVRVVMESGKASASILQRHFDIGYARAARLIGDMEEKGIIDLHDNHGVHKLNSKVETATNYDNANDNYDDLYNNAIQVVMSSGKGSVSLLQRRLRIGYSRAVRLIENMEKNGIIGPRDSLGQHQITQKK